MNHTPRIIAPVLPVAVCLMAGITTGYFYPQNSLSTLLTAIIILLVALFLRHFPRLQTTAIWLCTTVIGHWLAVHAVKELHTLPRSHDLIVCSTPVDKGKTMVMDALTADGKKVRLRMMTGTPAAIGNGLTVNAGVRPISYYPLYFDSHGYCGEVFAGQGQWSGKQVSTDGLSYLQRSRLRLLHWRELLLQRYQLNGIENDAYALTAAMTLGDKTAISSQLRETFSSTGASHVLALSGLHLGILYWLVTLLMAGRRRSSIVEVVTIMAIWAFAFLTGLAPSIVRSAIMLTLYALLGIGHREKMSVNALAVTAIAMLIASPLTLFDIGFQLSFTAVLAILVFYPLFNSLVSARYLQRHPLQRWAWGLTTISLSAQLGTAPLVAFYFGRLTPYFLLSNFIVIPAAYVIIISALLILITQLPFIANMLVIVVTFTVSALNSITQLPGASIEGLHPSILQVFLVYVVIGSMYLMLRVISKK